MQVQELMKDAVIGTIVSLDDPEQGLDSVTDWAAIRKVRVDCPSVTMGSGTLAHDEIVIALQAQHRAGGEERFESGGGTPCGG